MRYYDEFPHAARTAFRQAEDRARSGDREANATFEGIGITGAHKLLSTPDLFEQVALLIHRMEQDAATTALAALFGTQDRARVLSLFEDIFEETEFVAKGREDRIVRRIADGTHTQADVDWIRAQAESLTDDQLLEMRPFDGDESEAKELSRKVVRGRTPHTCHWTQQTIAPGERHLVIKEVVEGEFLTTRHSVLAAYLDVVGEDPGLAGHLAPQPQNAEAA